MANLKNNTDIKRVNDIIFLCVIGYELADLTVHPPPQKNDRGWVHFFA